MNSPLGVLYLPPPSRANALPKVVKKKKNVCRTEIIGLADLHAGYRPDMNFGSFATLTQNLLLVLRHRLNLSRSFFKFGFKVATVQYRQRWRHNDSPLPQPRPALLICQQHCAMSGEADTVIGRMSISPFWFIAGTRIYLRMGPKTNTRVERLPWSTIGVVKYKDVFTAEHPHKERKVSSLKAERTITEYITYIKVYI